MYGHYFWGKYRGGNKRFPLGLCSRMQDDLFVGEDKSRFYAAIWNATVLTNMFYMNAS